MTTAATHKAGTGKFLGVHFDARDHEPSAHFEADSIAEAQRKMNEMMWPQQKEIRVFNDEGLEVEIPLQKDTY